MKPEHGIRVCLTSAMVFTLACATVQAQLLGTQSGSVRYPAPMEAGAIKLALGVVIGKPPADVVEEANSVRLPQIEGLLLLGIPANFQIHLRLSTMILTNHLGAGARWVVDLQPWGLGIGFEYALLLGWWNYEGFNNSVRGRYFYPAISVGYDFGKVSATIAGNLSFITSYTTYTEEVEIETNENLFNGWTVTLFIEQPLWGDNYFTIGIKNNFVKSYYPVWQGFSTFDRYYYVPEFIFALRL